MANESKEAFRLVLESLRDIKSELRGMRVAIVERHEDQEKRYTSLELEITRVERRVKSLELSPALAGMNHGKEVAT